MRFLSFCMFLVFAAQVIGFSQTKSLQAFPLTDVRLLKSDFKIAQEADKKYMLSLDADRLLAPFIREAGLTPLAESYGNWENSGLDGHIGGHYLSALAIMYAATGDTNLLSRLNYTIGWLQKCQQKDADGYVGGVPGGKAMWEQVAAGKINAGGFSLNDKWVPVYNIHKLFAGLIDAYNLAGNKEAKTILVKLSEYFYRILSPLTDEQLQAILKSEHGGINEAFADVAELTSNKKYLELARRLSHRVLLEPLLQRRDVLNGMHANTQIPKVVGYQRIATLSGDTAWLNAADYFWHNVIQNRTVSFGGNSVREHFHPANDFSSMIETKEGPETCNTYNMLRLSKGLFLQHQSASYIDYYERALYNHILSSQHPDGGFVYFTPIRPQHYRVYSQPHQGMWCCVGTGLENHGKYGEMIYAYDGNDLYVNLFIPSELQWKAKDMVVKQQTDFPYDEKTKLIFTIAKPSQFAVHIRYPGWVPKGKLSLSINNEDVPVQKDSHGYVTINRTWKSGDAITVELPMQTKAEFLPDSSDWVSFVRGPIVLAAITDTTHLDGLRADASRMGHIANGLLYPIEKTPMIVSETKNFAKELKPVKGKALTFTASKLIYPQQYKRLQLVPFYTVHDARYMMYWHYTTPQNLEVIKENIRKTEAAKIALEAITIDQVAPGEQQPESDHNFKGEHTESGVFKDRHWRHAKGWFSYDLNNPGQQAQKLRITYSGQDKNRSFDIYVNNILLATVNSTGIQGDTFFDADYPLPPGIMKQKTITVKFVAKEQSIAGGIFYVRLLK